MAGAVKKTVTFLERFFSPVFQRMPQLLVIISLIGWALGEFRVVPHLDKLEKPFLAILAGGFFALLAKGALFREILSEELTSILYTPDHLDRRKDIATLWRNATVAAGLPASIADLVYDQLLKGIWNEETPYLYQDLRRTHILRWDPADKNKLLCESHVVAELIPAQPDKAFTKKGALTCHLVGAAAAPATLHSKFRCSVTQKDYSAPFAVDPANPEVYRSEVNLPASPMYKVDERWEFAQNVAKDNMIMFQSPVFVKGMSVAVEYDPAEMLVLFMEVGRIGFKPVPVGKNDRVRLKMEAQPLMPPWSGYVIAVQRV